jgi:hypothetical protein
MKVIPSAGKKCRRNQSPSPALEAKKPKAVGYLESPISYSDTGSVEKPLLNVVDNEESNYLEIYDLLVSIAGEFKLNSST